MSKLVGSDRFFVWVVDPGGEIVLIQSVSDALDRLGALAEETGGGIQVLVTGSVLLVGDVLGELVQRGHWAPTYPGAS
jgi:hypothetical protein|eukprot:COSAG02_NODE_1676_length_11364_cov_12.500755_5_plen_78_part_00